MRSTQNEATAVDDHFRQTRNNEPFRVEILESQYNCVENKKSPLNKESLNTAEMMVRSTQNEATAVDDHFRQTRNNELSRVEIVLESQCNGIENKGSPPNKKSLNTAEMTMRSTQNEATAVDDHFRHTQNNEPSWVEIVLESQCNGIENKGSPLNKESLNTAELAMQSTQNGSPVLTTDQSHPQAENSLTKELVDSVIAFTRQNPHKVLGSKQTTQENGVDKVKMNLRKKKIEEVTAEDDSISKDLPERKRTKSVTVVSGTSDRRAANEIVDLVGKDSEVDFPSYPIRKKAQRKEGRYKFILVRYP